MGAPWKARKNDVGSTHSADHGVAHAYGRALAQAIGPGSGRVDHPSGFYAIFLAGKLIAEQHASRSAVRYIDCQYSGIIAYYGTSLTR